MTDYTPEQKCERLVDIGILNRDLRWMHLDHYIVPGQTDLPMRADEAVGAWNVAGRCLETWPENDILLWRISQRVDEEDASKGLVCQNPGAIIDNFLAAVDAGQAK